MARAEVVVRWGAERRESGVAGKAIAIGGRQAPTKIVFPARGLSSQRVAALEGVWRCEVECDTKPLDPHRGALIVVPLRPVTWGVVARGPELYGAREYDWGCVEYPEIDTYYGPTPPISVYEEIRLANEPWREALDKRALWQGSIFGSLAARFLSLFGPPSSVTADGEHVVLVYQHGTKRAPADELQTVWPSSPTGQGRVDQRSHSVSAEFRYVDHPTVSYWVRVAYLQQGPYAPSLTDAAALLDADTRAVVLSLLRESAIGPAESAALLWESHRSQRSGAQIWTDLVGLHYPIARVYRDRQQVERYYAESDDGYRAGGYGTATVVNDVLRTETGAEFGAHHADFGLCSERYEQTPLDAETERRRMITERWKELEKLLAVPDEDEPDEEITGIPAVEWREQFAAAWRALAEAYQLERGAAAAALYLERMAGGGR